MAKLERSQAEAVFQDLHPSLGYLYRLKQRLVHVGFVESDKLYQLARKAFDSMQAPRPNVGVSLAYFEASTSLADQRSRKSEIHVLKYKHKRGGSQIIRARRSPSHKAAASATSISIEHLNHAPIVDRLMEV
jgi:hypothetical protein